MNKVKASCRKKFGQEIAVLLAGDFNAHNVSWNCKDTDYSGRVLLEDTEEEDLFIVNTDTMSRMENIIQQDSNIDIIFANKKLADRTRYKQLDDTWGSDHYRILVEIDIQKSRYKKKTNRKFTKKNKVARLCDRNERTRKWTRNGRIYKIRNTKKI